MPAPQSASLPERKASRFQIFVWTLFDFADRSFSVMIVTVGYSLYFKEIVAGGTGRGDFLWGLAVSLSMLLTAIISPFAGAASDFSSRRKRFLLGFTLVSIICSALLFFVREDMVILGITLFVLANIGFEGGLVFYDAFLPLITTERSYGRVSGYGFAMGYIGALATLLLAQPFYAKGFAPENLLNVRLSFVMSAAFFLVFSTPIFLFLYDHKREVPKKFSYFKIGYERVAETIRQLKNYRNVARYLLAFFIYNDGILTVIAFASIYAEKTLNFTLQEILIFFTIVQSTAIIGSIIFGIITDHIGPKKTITVTLLLWIIIVSGAYVATSKDLFYAVGLLAGACLGATQSASRSFMAQLTPKEREAEFFGFYDGLCGKASAVFGTLLFGYISWVTGSQRTAVISVGLFFLVGLFLLQRVEEKPKAQFST